jgi:hypothetical protein
MVFVHYLFDHQKTKNPVDRAVIDAVKTLLKAIFGNRPKPDKKWSEAIESAILMYSDVQVVTGIGILISGYTQIPQGLSLYHWQIVVYLAWFSSLSHLTTLTVLRKFFRDQPRLAAWRVFFMGFIILLLGIGLVPTGWEQTWGWSGMNPLSIPVVCMFSTASVRVYSTFNWLYILLSLMFLVISYTSRIISIFAGTTNMAKKYLRTLPGNFWKAALFNSWKRSKSSTWKILKYFWACVHTILLTVYVIAKIFVELGLSMLWEVSCASKMVVSVNFTDFTLPIKDILASLSVGLGSYSPCYGTRSGKSLRRKRLGLWPGFGRPSACSPILFSWRTADY